ncbi:acyl-CoA dehydrogenase family protein [Sphingomonas sp. TX0522]|uniref:acyl-CoA dehydrogenase family protein n=1 Tax=Sphingomonas sp. TX0522 TaxID=2479205 RepID=UPI0018DF7369|nr:acyl-CoA dehydrogenase family protein [Sphingomonas sp. TX0522]MBI0531993.1 acyl-CoA dehydrogenase [Sphingomonas sp. TX0522]
MNLEPSPRTRDLLDRLQAFMATHVYPAEQAILDEAMNQPDDFRQWQPLTTLEMLKEKAKAAGLWNLFLPDSEHGAGLTNLEYAPLAEMMGRSYWAPEVFNCDAPNTGNMETLVRYGSLEQQERWLRPLLAGKIRSAYAMTEPDTASSDATNIRMTMRVEGDELVIAGRKWWTSGAGDPRCEILIVMGLTDPDGEDRHRRQSMVLVPTDTPGVRIRRYLPIIGVSDSPHGHMEVVFDDVRVPLSNVLLGVGRGFEIAQGRLGPGRIHHCMRMIGIAERALERICRRLSSRTTFGTRIADQSLWRWRIAEVRCRIEQARLLTLKTAWMMDTVGNKAARAEIAMIKIVAPRLATEVVDMAIQAFGGGGFADGAMTMAYIYARTTCVADGPDEVHANQLARFELGRWSGDGADTGGWSDVIVTQGRDYEVAA